jgi:hypothetical protein
MTWTRGRVRLLEAATWWMPAYMVLFFVVWLLSFVGMAGGGVLGAAFEGMAVPDVLVGVYGVVMAVIMGSWVVIVPLHLLTMVLGIAVAVVYMAHALGNERLDQTQRLLWALLCFMGGFVGQLFYLYKEVKPQLAEA